MLLCKLFHFFFANLVHGLIDLGAHDEYATVGAVVIL